MKGHLPLAIPIQKARPPHTKEPGFLILTSKNPPGFLENYFISVTRWICTIPAASIRIR